MINTESQFIARQPIFNNQEQLFAYEILYRNSEKNQYPKEVSDVESTSHLSFNSILLHDIKQISNGSLIFINLSTQSLLDKLPKLINPKHVVIEITERTEDLINVCLSIKELKKKKYKFALDDYDGDHKWDDILQEVDYIKLEVESPLLITLLKIKKLKRQYPKKKIIVERIEDYESYRQLKRAGSDYFQGYYFAKPEMKQLTCISPTRLVVLALIKLANDKEFSFHLIQKEIEKDISLSIRLLRLINNICKTQYTPFTSLYQAIIYLGEDMLRQFIKILAISTLSSEKPSELVTLSLFRARFISTMIKSDNKHMRKCGYLVGLMSLLDVILNVDLNVILIELNIHHCCRAALLNYEGEIGSLLHLCKKVEMNDWQGVNNIAKALNLDLNVIKQQYQSALNYADNTLNVKQTEAIV